MNIPRLDGTQTQYLTNAVKNKIPEVNKIIKHHIDKIGVPATPAKFFMDPTIYLSKKYIIKPQLSGSGITNFHFTGSVSHAQLSINGVIFDTYRNDPKSREKKENELNGCKTIESLVGDAYTIIMSYLSGHNGNYDQQMIQLKNQYSFWLFNNDRVLPTTKNSEIIVNFFTPEPEEITIEWDEVVFALDDKIDPLNFEYPIICKYFYTEFMSSKRNKIRLPFNHYTLSLRIIASCNINCASLQLNDSKHYNFIKNTDNEFILIFSDSLINFSCIDNICVYIDFDELAANSPVTFEQKFINIIHFQNQFITLKYSMNL